jgi:hypothetical protein
VVVKLVTRRILRDVVTIHWLNTWRARCHTSDLIPEHPVILHSSLLQTPGQKPADFYIPCVYTCICGNYCTLQCKAFQITPYVNANITATVMLHGIHAITNGAFWLDQEDTIGSHWLANYFVLFYYVLKDFSIFLGHYSSRYAMENGLGYRCTLHCNVISVFWTLPDTLHCNVISVFRTLDIIHISVTYQHLQAVYIAACSRHMPCLLQQYTCLDYVLLIGPQITYAEVLVLTHEDVAFLCQSEMRLCQYVDVCFEG